jgi:RHS repeat-associated protein
VPAGSLQDGVTYYWKIFTWDGWGPPAPMDPGTPVWSSWPPAKLKVNLRLGDGGPSPADGAGPVKVNLATGNVTTTVSSPSLSVVGGSMGVSYTYNSRQPQGGLTGSYYKDCNGSTGWPATPSAVRTDPAVDFVWSGSPVPGLLGSENYCVRWSGLISVPSSGNYCFDASHDDGIRMWVAGQLVIDRWSDQSTNVGAYGVNCVNFFSDATVPVTVEYYNHLGPGRVRLWAYSGQTSGLYIPASWLSTTPKTLPGGWTLSAGADGLSYAKATIGTDTVTLFEPDGTSHEYRKSSTGAWTPEPGEDSVLTAGAEPNGTSTYVVHGDDGITYTFNSSGVLIRARAAVDDLHPAAPTFEFAADSGRPSSITDPVTGRQITLSYSNLNGGVATNCPSAPSGFDAYPAGGLLCKVHYWDNTETDLFYVNGQLGRIVDPGGATANFAYNASGLLTQVRDSLANDMVAANQRADDATTWTVIAYDSSSRAQTVTLPAPTSGALRPSHTYRYVSATETQIDVAGISPTVGFSRRVRFNTGAQTTSDTDAGGVESVMTWDGADRMLTTIAANNDTAKSLETTVIYDDAGRPVHNYGPARPSCFTGQSPNGSCSGVPDATTAYDEGTAGVGAAYWNNATLAGGAAKHSTGIGDATGAVNANWGAGSPVGLPVDNWSMRLTGDVLLPSTGTYSAKLTSVDTGDKARLWVDDVLLVDAWNGGTAWSNTGSFSGSAGTRHRVRIDYADVGGNASLQLLWTPPGGAQAIVPGANLGPRYGLTTSSVDPDGRKATSEYADVANGIGPEFGLATASSQWLDATTQLRSTTTYESPSASTYLRRTVRTLPKGAATATTYAYYASGDAAPGNDCGGGVSVGLVKSETGALDSTGGRIVRQFVYDSLNRVVGSRVVGDTNWSCRAYDSRGRIVTDRDSNAVTTSVDYSVPGTVTTSFVDSAGTPRMTVSKVDLLGQATSYTDEHNTLTRVVYDRLGRAFDSYRTFSGGAESHLATWGYDSATGRMTSVTDYSANPQGRTTSFQYDTAGRLTTTARPNNVTSTTAFNTGTGQVDSLTHASGATSLASSSYTYTTGGRVFTETSMGRLRTFSYDGAGRLTQTVEGATTRKYAYDANSNRCATADTCASPIYAYDNADRLTASPFGRNYQYDSHGNLKSATPNGTQPSGSLSDSWTYDAAASNAPHTVPLTINGSGTLSANLDTTATPTYASGTATGSVAANGASSAPVAIRGQSFVKASLTWTQGAGGYAPVTLRLKDGSGTLATSVSGSTGSLDLSYVTPDTTGTWTLEVADTSSSIGVPSFTMPWSATTASTTALSGSLVPGGTASRGLTADAQGRLSAAATYSQGVKTVSASPAGTVGMGGTVNQAIAVSASGAVNASVDWAPVSTYTSGSPTGSIAASGTWSGPVPVRGRSYLKATLAWTASANGMATTTLRFKDQTGAVVKSLSGAAGTLAIGYITPDVAAGYTVEIVDNSSDKSVPSFSLQWSATTAVSYTTGGNLAPGATTLQTVSAAGQGVISVDGTYNKGSIQSAPANLTGSVAPGASSDQTVSVTGDGLLTGTLDWASLPVYTAQNSSPSLTPGSAPWSTPITANGPSHLYGLATWNQDSHNVPSSQTGSVVGGSNTTKLFTVTGTSGTISFSTDWATTSAGTSWSARATATAVQSKAVTVSANGTLSATINWTNGTIPSILELTLLDPNGNQVDTSSTQLGDASASVSVPVTASLSNKKTYTLEVRDTGADVDFTTSGSAPVTPDVDLELWDPAGTTKKAFTTSATAKPETLSYTMQAGDPTGAYRLKVLSKDYFATFNVSAGLPTKDYASVTVRLRDSGGTALKTASSATGTVELGYLTGGNVQATLEVVDSSTDLSPVGLSVVWSNTTGAVQSLPSSVAAGTTTPIPLTAADQGWITTSALWQQDSHNVGSSVSGSVSANGTDTKTFNVTGSGTISATVDWASSTGSLSQSSRSVSATAPWSRTFTASANGSINASINWTNGTVPSTLELTLYDANDNQLDTSSTLPGATTASVSYSPVSASLTNKQSFKLVVTDTGTGTQSFNVTGSYPVTANVDLELWDPAGTTKKAFTSSTTTKPETLSYALQTGDPTGNYRLKVVSRDFFASYSGQLSVPTLGYAAVVGRLKDSGGSVVKTVNGAAGSLELAYKAPTAGSYTLELQNTSTDLVARTMTGTVAAPVVRTPSLYVAILDPNGVSVATPTTTKPATVSYSVPVNGPFGSYTFHVYSDDWPTTYSMVESHFVGGYATVAARLKNAGGAVVASATSNNGAFSLDYLAPAAGSYTLELQNQSSDFTARSWSMLRAEPAQRTPNLDLELYDPSGNKVAQAANTASAKPESLSYTVPSGGPFGSYQLKVVSRDYDAAWTMAESHPVSGFATVVGRLKDAGGAVVATTTSSSGSLSLDYLSAGAGAYTLELQDTSTDFAVPSYSGTATNVQQRYGSLAFQLKDSGGAVVASGSAGRPSVLSTSVAPGDYTLSATPLTGSGTASLSGSYPRAAKEVITYDGRDHATSIDDGGQTVVETVSPSGRVIERVVRDDSTGAVLEDTLLGYADGGDSPAYSRPAGPGPASVTTYVGGPGGLLVTTSGATESWALANGHGDVVATVDANGAFTAAPAADEFGVGQVPGSRLGWLGTKERFSTGGTLGLTRMGVRLYDPALGRFLEVDPVEAGSCNDYDYVCNDPTNSLDLGGTKRGCSFFSGAPIGRLLRCPKKKNKKLIAIQQNVEGLKRQLRAHQKKLRDYQEDPLAYDNDGRLEQALLGGHGERVVSIIRGRIRNLQRQIDNFKRQIRDQEMKELPYEIEEGGDGEGGGEFPLIE